MDVRDIFLVIVALFRNVWNVGAEISATDFQIEANYNYTYCSANTSVHGKVSSDLFCAQKCSRIEGCVGFFYNINTRVCSTLKNVPQPTNECETEAGSVFYINTDIKQCYNPPPLANGILLSRTVNESIVVCNSHYFVKRNGIVSVGTQIDNVNCSRSDWDSVECVAACDSAVALATTSIISASSVSSAVNGPGSSSLNNFKAWIPKIINQQQYLQYQFYNTKIVNEIVTQGGGKKLQWTTSYKIYFSNDCVNYIDYGTIFNGNVDISSHVSNVINPAILAICLRVNPQAWSEKIAMRVELKGC